MAHVKSDAPLYFKTVAWREWGWVLVVSACVIFAANLPYLAGYAAETEDLQFAGITVAPVDNLSYRAKMRQGEAGSWLHYLPYTAQDHEGASVYLFYLFLGHAANWTGLDVLFVFHLSRVVCGLALLVTVYFFIAQLTDILAERRFMFVLAAFSSGFGWLMLLLGELRSSDLSIPESNTFFTLMDCPHFAFVQMLTLVIWLCYLPALQSKGRWQLTILGGVAVVLLTIVQPFMLAVIFGTLGVVGLVIWVQERRFPWALIRQGGVHLLLVVPPLLNAYHAIYNNPAMLGWRQQSPEISPPPIYFLVGFAPVLLMALSGVGWALRHHRTGLVLVCWILVAAIGLYFPVDFQRRLSQGLHLPLALLAGLAIYRVWMPRWSPARRWLYARLYLLATLPTSLVLIGLFAGSAATHNEWLFISTDEANALAWIEAEAEPNQIILSSTALGAFIPALIYQRAVSGHEFETLNAEEVKQQVRDFYAADTGSAYRADLLHEWQVDYIIVGPRERALGIDVLDQEGVAKEATFGDVDIYVTISQK